MPIQIDEGRHMPMPAPTRSSSDGKFRLTVRIAFRLDIYRLSMMILSDFWFLSERQRQRKLKALNSRRKLYAYAGNCFLIHGCFGVDDASQHEDFVVHQGGLTEDEWEEEITEHCQRLFPDLD